MTERTTIWIGTREIAAKLDLSIATFRRSIDRLTEKDGFPLPSSHRLKPMTWRRAAVDAWIESQGYTVADLRELPPGKNPGATVHLLRTARAG